MQNVATCPNCGATRRPTARFCGACGSKHIAVAVGLLGAGFALDATVDYVQETAATHIETIASYNSPEFAEKLNSLPDHLQQIAAVQAATAEPDALLQGIAEQEELIDNAQEGVGSLIDFVLRLLLQ